MYIIDKNKDYYDYLSHIYGQDKKIVFDRRGSINITDEHIYSIINFYPSNNKYFTNDYFILLEVGNVQYLIQVFNIKYKNSIGGVDFVSYKMKILYTYKDNKHRFDSPISIRKVSLKWYWRKWKDKRYVLNGNFEDEVQLNYTDNTHIIKLPILAKTKITSLVNPEEIWKELQTYFSSLENDPDISIPMTDVEKAEVHGFDKKTSFRHPVK